MQRWLKVVTVVLGIVSLSACSRVTLANYEKLKVGMSYEEVKGILGDPEKCSELLVVTQCSWGDSTRGVSANFMADKLVTHSSSNLH